MNNIAVTGSYASGKSFVLECAQSMGYKIFSCDNYVRELYQDINLQKFIESKIEKLGKFNKKRLARIIYSDSDSRKKLESIIHPKVRGGIKSFEQQNAGEKIIFTEVPLLFESGFDKYFLYTLCVFCSEDTRIARAKSRGNINSEFFEKIKKIQLSQEEKKVRANFTIDSEKDVNQIKIVLTEIIDSIK